MAEGGHRVTGGALHSGLPRGRTGGELWVAGGVLRFDNGAGVTQSLPLPGLRISTGGAADRLLYFSHASVPDWSLYTDDRRVLDAPEFASRRDLARQRSAANSHRRQVWLGVVLTLTLLAIPVVGLILARHTLVRLAAERVPPALERQVGNAAWAQLSMQFKPLADEELERLLGELAAPLLAALPGGGEGYSIHLLDDPMVNAFAVPGGLVGICSGLLLAARTPEEVAGVLAHELAHVEHRHGLRAVIGQAGRLAVLYGVIGDFAGMGHLLISGADTLLRQKYSRDHEREADATGWALLVAADIDPRGMIQFFQTLAEREKNTGDPLYAALTLLQTHPATTERIARLEALAAELPERSWPPMSVDFAALQQRLAERVSHPLPTTTPEAAPHE